MEFTTYPLHGTFRSKFYWWRRLLHIQRIKFEWNLHEWVNFRFFSLSFTLYIFAHQIGAIFHHMCLTSLVKTRNSSKFRPSEAPTNPDRTSIPKRHVRIPSEIFGSDSGKLRVGVRWSFRSGTHCDFWSSPQSTSIMFSPNARWQNLDQCLSPICTYLYRSWPRDYRMFDVNFPIWTVMNSFILKMIGVSWGHKFKRLLAQKPWNPHFKLEVPVFRMAPGMMIVTGDSYISKNWSLENGYTNQFEYKLRQLQGVYDYYHESIYDKEYPIRIGHPGQGAALIVELRTNTDNFEYNCNGFDQSFKIALTSPGEAIKMTNNFFRVSSAEYSLIAIKSKLIKTSEGLRSYKPYQRQCYYNSERRLRFYRMYAQSNCEIECLANFTNMACGCVKLSMPSI